MLHEGSAKRRYEQINVCLVNSQTGLGDAGVLPRHRPSIDNTSKPVKINQRQLHLFDIDP
jgi:hypothetical protein